MKENNLRVKVTLKDKAISTNNESTFDQRKFISDIYECEKQRYIFNERLRELFLKRTIGPADFPKEFKASVQYKNYCKDYKKKKIFPNKVSPLSENAFIDDLQEYTPVTVFIGIIIGVISDFIFETWKTGLIVFVISIIVGAVMGILKYINDKTEYKDYLDEVESIKNQNNQIVKYNNERYKYWEDEYYKEKQMARNRFDENECVLIDNEAEMIRETKSEVEATLNELYNLRINGVLCLHPNYQGLIPISIIYGYFDTGRCNQLQGHEGAYNLYEDEKMKGMIINKLEIVSKQLGELNNTMVYVGKAIEECNEQLYELESKSERMISSVNCMNNNVTTQLNGVYNQMSAIQENTANSAYYAEVGAKMTTFNTVYNMLKD